MKKLITITLIALSLFSCSKDDSDIQEETITQEITSKSYTKRQGVNRYTVVMYSNNTIDFFFNKDGGFYFEELGLTYDSKSFNEFEDEILEYTDININMDVFYNKETKEVTIYHIGGESGEWVFLD